METSEKQNTTIDVSQEEESANNNHAIKGRAIDLAASGEYAKQKLRDTLIDSIPVDFVKALPSKYSLSAGVFVICLQMAIFLYFTISGYLADQSAFFISLDKSSGICVEVPRAVSGTFMSTSGGVWQGSSTFSILQANYVFDLDTYEATTEEYAAHIRSVQSALTKLKPVLAANPFIENLLYEVAYEYQWVVDGKTQKFKFAGDVRQTFISSMDVPFLLGPKGLCAYLFPDSSYNSFSRSVEITFNATTYNESYGCRDIANPKFLGYPLITFKEPDTFQTIFDVASFAVALAVNLGILPISYLEASSYSYEFIYNDIAYKGNVFWYTRYPGMKPIICVQPVVPSATALTLCMAPTGGNNDDFDGVYGIPIVAPLDSDCTDCSTATDDGSCEYLLHNMGYVAFPGGYTNPTLFLDAVARHGSYDAFNTNTMVILKSLDETGISEQICNDVANCYILVWYTTAVPTTYFNDYGIELEMHCKDTALVPPTATFNTWASNPPSPLVEPYYKCVNYPANSISNAVGVASGNASIIVPIGAFIVLPLMYLYLRLVGVTAKVSDEEEEEKLKEVLKQMAEEYIANKNAKVSDSVQKDHGVQYASGPIADPIPMEMDANYEKGSNVSQASVSSVSLVSWYDPTTWFAYTQVDSNESSKK